MKQTLFLLTLLLTTLSLNAQQSERDYQLRIQQQLGGQMEVPVESGRIDLLTDEYAIEIEFANKWKEAIGQALWYGLQTNRTPGIILIKREGHPDQKYVIQLGSALSYAGLGQVRVWVWPDDFSTARTVAPQQSKQPSSPAGQYWLNTSSDKRHNATCRNFNNTKRGRFCTATEGVACGICGG